MNEKKKVEAYDRLNPGVDIPSEQKAERIDRKIIREKYAGRTRVRGSSIVGTITVPDGPFWCECGLLRHAGTPCKE